MPRRERGHGFPRPTAAGAPREPTAGFPSPLLGSQPLALTRVAARSCFAFDERGTTTHGTEDRNSLARPPRPHKCPALPAVCWVPKAPAPGLICVATGTGTGAGRGARAKAKAGTAAGAGTGQRQRRGRIRNRTGAGAGTGQGHGQGQKQGPYSRSSGRSPALRSEPCASSVRSGKTMAPRHTCRRRLSPLCQLCAESSEHRARKPRAATISPRPPAAPRAPGGWDTARKQPLQACSGSGSGLRAR